METVPRGWPAGPQQSSDIELDRKRTHDAEKDASDDENGAPLTDDSSEEEDDDEEEALKVQEGFIVDDEEDDEGAVEEVDQDRKSHKHKRHKRQSQCIQVTIYLFVPTNNSANSITRGG
jgi:hypothetical protein